MKETEFFYGHYLREKWLPVVRESMDRIESDEPPRDAFEYQVFEEPVILLQRKAAYERICIKIGLALALGIPGESDGKFYIGKLPVFTDEFPYVKTIVHINETAGPNNIPPETGGLVLFRPSDSPPVETPYRLEYRLRGEWVPQVVTF